MEWSPALIDLRKILADLYKTEADARRLIGDARLDDSQIDFSGKAINIWTSVLTYAFNNGQVDDVIWVARDQYSGNTKLAAAEQQWLAEQRNGLPTVLICYHQEDETWKERLVTHLGSHQHEVRLRNYNVRDIAAYSDRFLNIQSAMNQASVAVLLVSPDFLCSPFIRENEITLSLQRLARQGLRIFPIVVRPCAWTLVKWLARMEPRPIDGRALSGKREYEVDGILTAIAEEVASVLSPVETAKRDTVLSVRPIRRKGPGHVKFVVVAGRDSELIAVRKNVDCYGDDSLDWRPYFPRHDRRAISLLQFVAACENLISSSLDLGPDIADQLRNAEGENTVVVIAVDPWSIRLAPYHDLMREFDGKSFLNCAVLVPWNNDDDETKTNRSHLMTALQITFTHRFADSNLKLFRNEISSPEQLERELRDVFIEIQRRILESGEVARRAEGEGIIVQPFISSPGGI
jgi:FxsC-like protein